MEIKEYKLGDVCVVKNGTKNKEDCSKNGKYNFYTRSKIVLKSNDWTVDGECTIIPGEGIFYPLWNNGKAAIHQRVYYIKSNELILKNKYLYYWWFKNSWILYQNAVGTTVKSLRMNNFLDPKIKLPNIQTQQKIINIIEPFEKLQNSLKKKINTLEIMMLKIANQSHALGKMKNFDIDFEKGINIKSIYLTNQKTDKTFINVSAINNKPNKYLLNCEVIENINYGDVVLSLDGTIGLVNNFLKGVNGYGYKVTSNNIHNSIIYCSLIDERNKKIIQENSNGSVIKHSSNSKKELLLLDIQNKNVISFFNLQVIYKKTLNIIDYIIDKLINLCL